MLRHIGIEKNDNRVKQFGLPRTSTNYVRFLLESNYSVKVLVDKEGWKHGYVPPTLPPRRKCVVVTKNPYAWLSSVFEFYQKAKKEVVSMNVSSIDRFIHSEFVLYRMGVLMAFQNPICCWNDMNRHWLAIPVTGRKSCVVRHEDMLEAPGLHLDRLAGQLLLRRTSKNFIDTDRSFKPTSDAPINLSQNKFKQDYYARSRYLEKFSDQNLLFIEQTLDMGIMKSLDYKILT